MSKNTVVRNPSKEGVNQIKYFTAPTLPELEKIVNHNIEKFENNDDENFHYSAESSYDLQYVNGEYVQKILFLSFRRIQMRRRKPPAKPKKKVETKES